MDILPVDLIIEILRLLESPELVSLACKKLSNAYQRMIKLNLHVRKIPRELLASGNVEAFLVLYNPSKRFERFIKFCSGTFLEKWKGKLIFTKKIVLIDALKVGNLDLVKWLRKQGCAWDCDAFKASAEYGNIENMKWLKEQGCLWNPDTFAYAAKYGNLDIMKWLKEQECPWNTKTFFYSSEYGDLDNMKWLREQGCPWNTNVFWMAARCGNLENMKWLREQGCPWDLDTFRAAVGNGNEQNIKWLVDEGCENWLY